MTSPIRPVPAAPVFSRREWERAVLASDLHPSDRAVALVLAHLAGGASVLPAGGTHTYGRLSTLTRVSYKGVKQSLVHLQAGGFIDRPDVRTWADRRIWPVTLTMPPAPTPPVAAEERAARTEPAHPGLAAS